MRASRVAFGVAIVVGLSGNACSSAPEPSPETGAAIAGNAEAGKTYWEQPNTLCALCHGDRGEGAFGPSLAGRRLTLAQFSRQVRQPWGLMPRWTEHQISDQTLADVHAYFVGLPPTVEPGPWLVTAPPDAPLAVRYWVETVGCGQCHGDDLKAALIGAEGQTDYAWVSKRAYAHTEDFPTGAMGTYSRDRLPEVVLRDMWLATKDGADEAPPATP